MTDRASARHRADKRALTPLSSLSSTVTDHVAFLGRGGVALAMSSGLVATLGLPAQATTHRPAAATRTAATSATTTALVMDAALMTGSSGIRAAAPVSAPATAAVAFDAVGFTATKAAPPRAATAGRASRSGARAAVAAPRAAGVLGIAQRYFGVRYRYGGTTPSGFDCSGYVGYVFRQVGIRLPRTANAQMHAVKRISRSQARPGDLVFFVSGGRAYHVGIYVGGNMMYDSPRPGRTVGKHPIWTSAVVFGRP